MKNYLLFDTIQDFLVWLRTGSYPADINRFRSHTGKLYYLFYLDDGGMGLEGGACVFGGGTKSEYGNSHRNDGKF